MYFSSAFNTETNIKVAIKKLARPFQSSIHAKRTYRELRMLKHMDHENVSALCNFWSWISCILYCCFCVSHLMKSSWLCFVDCWPIRCVHTCGVTTRIWWFVSFKLKISLFWCGCTVVLYTLHGLYINTCTRIFRKIAFAVTWVEWVGCFWGSVYNCGSEGSWFDIELRICQLTDGELILEMIHTSLFHSVSPPIRAMDYRFLTQ